MKGILKKLIKADHFEFGKKTWGEVELGGSMIRCPKRLITYFYKRNLINIVILNYLEKEFKVDREFILVSEMNNIG
jgi:hypothetical protein